MATSSDAYVTAVGIGELFVDVTYQRPLDNARARQMARGWDRRLAGIVEVSDRGELASRRFAVIDGQHRWAAAREAGFKVMVANVHNGLSVADEARLFDRLNRERRRITTWDHWFARRASGEPTVGQIEKIAQAIGLVIDSSPRTGHVRCTATLEKLHKLGGADLVQHTLEFIVSVWGRDLAGFDAPIVHGLGLVLFHLGSRDLDVPRLGEALLEVAPRQLKSKAIMLREIETATMPKLVAIAVVAQYNTRPGRRILVSSRTFGPTSRNAHSTRTAAA